ncbi:hypothetical protein B0H67DRAFT_120243 [Lasiosphaeris hirsuta]|uniref:Uncharacterized protein n=1 Tax=Lasiosphaeris hirsuta TaxID=260670 RepID=A0AA40AZR5_9PEZI|nr:hypothetical protein B0H67DRAFT_120243 [Lasiosphaeris hirsuta]
MQCTHRHRGAAPDMFPEHAKLDLRSNLGSKPCTTDAVRPQAADLAILSPEALAADAVQDIAMVIRCTKLVSHAMGTHSYRGNTGPYLTHSHTSSRPNKMISDFGLGLGLRHSRWLGISSTLQLASSPFDVPRHRSLAATILQPSATSILPCVCLPQPHFLSISRRCALQSSLCWVEITSVLRVVDHPPGYLCRARAPELPLTSRTHTLN